MKHDTVLVYGQVMPFNWINDQILIKTSEISMAQKYIPNSRCQPTDNWIHYWLPKVYYYLNKLSWWSPKYIWSPCIESIQFLIPTAQILVSLKRYWICWFSAFHFFTQYKHISQIGTVSVMKTRWNWLGKWQNSNHTWTGLMWLKDICKERVYLMCFILINSGVNKSHVQADAVLLLTKPWQRIKWKSINRKHFRQYLY